jgi:hypothetical protein
VSALKRADILRNDSYFRRIGALALTFLLPLENFAPKTGISRSPWARTSRLPSIAPLDAVTLGAEAFRVFSKSGFLKAM